MTRRLPRASARAARRPIGLVAALVQFTLAGLVVLGLVLWGTAIGARRAATTEAIRDARERTEILGRAVIAPVVRPGLASLDPDALRAVDDAVRTYALSDQLRRVKIWEASGRIIYADDARLIGEVYPLDDEELDVLRDGGVVADVSDLSSPENRFEDADQLLEVYFGIDTAIGEPLLFEAYFRYDEVRSSAHRIRDEFQPLFIGAGLLFFVLQIPLAWRLASQIQRARRERERLLHSAVEASMVERRRIASDLHDGVVQELAGVTFGLAGVADRLALAGRVDDANVVDGVAGETRNAIGALWSLLVEIYPPNLRDAGIRSALEGLLASAASRGIATSLDIEVPRQLDERSEALVFRAAQEMLRNVARHAHARSVEVRLWRVGNLLSLTVSDDGVGFTHDAANAARAEGHVGLRLLDDLATQAGGSFTIEGRPNGGTRAILEVPLS